MEADERRKVSLIQALATIRNEKVAIRKESAQRRKQVREGGRPAPTEHARLGYLFSLSFFTHSSLFLLTHAWRYVWCQVLAFFFFSQHGCLYVCMPFPPIAPDYVRSRCLVRFSLTLGSMVPSTRTASGKMYASTSNVCLLPTPVNRKHRRLLERPEAQERQTEAVKGHRAAQADEVLASSARRGTVGRKFSCRF